MKFCKDCRFYEPSPGDDKYLDICRAKPPIDMVRSTPGIRIAYDTRGRDFECGKDAIWFEPKEVLPC